jgi:hypothetical protein
MGRPSLPADRGGSNTSGLTSTSLEDARIKGATIDSSAQPRLTDTTCTAWTR